MKYILVMVLGMLNISYAWCPVNAHYDSNVGCVCNEGFIEDTTATIDISSSEKPFKCVTPQETPDVYITNNTSFVQNNSEQNLIKVVINKRERETTNYTHVPGSFMFIGMGMGKLSSGFESKTTPNVSAGAWLTDPLIWGIDAYLYGTSTLYGSIIMDFGGFAKNGIGVTVGVGLAYRERITKAYPSVNLKVLYDFNKYLIFYTLVQGNGFGRTCTYTEIEDMECEQDLSDTREFGLASDIRIGFNYKL